MKNKHYKDIVDQEYDKILLKIVTKGSVAILFGENIDTENPKELVVAAYYIAKQEELNKKIEGWKNRF